MEISAFGGQAKPVAVNATGFNRWKFTCWVRWTMVLVLDFGKVYFLRHDLKSQLPYQNACLL
jgi:hypothetical protein